MAMMLNFTLNNKFTYKSHQLRGLAFIKGFVSFACACSLGGILNVSIAHHLFEQGVGWGLAGLLGGFLGGIWNYAITKTFTWKAA